MEPGNGGRVFRQVDARELIAGSSDEHSASVLQRGTLNLKLSLPVRPNRQSPHAQDEIYVIVRGRGILWHGGRRDPFEAGDAIFIAAGTEHHFEEFSDDTAVWVVFYGPEGGELPRPSAHAG
jgi:mannose-6-phosphate isomerase-like protein (cupin superfamily)